MFTSVLREKQARVRKSRKLNDKDRQKVVEEINRFNKLIAGHRRLLEAIGAL